MEPNSKYAVFVQNLTSRALDEPARFADLKARFIDVPRHIATWAEASNGLRGKRVVDYGSGTGEIALGVALSAGPEILVGVQLEPEPVTALEQAATITAMTAPASLRFTATAEFDANSYGEFDFGYSWSSLDHLGRDRFDNTLRHIYKNLVLGGRFLLQFGKMYYSPDGGGLMAHGVPPWGHLFMSRQELVATVVAHHAGDTTKAAAILSTFDTISRLSCPEVIEACRRVGFHVVRSYTTRSDIALPANLDAVYRADVLTEQQLVILLSRN